jgi:hypothetical protein
MKAKEKILYFLIPVLMLMSCKKADEFIVLDNDAQTWTLNANEYTQYMSLVGITNPASDTSDILGAFIKGELAGISTIETHQGQLLHFMLIYGNQTDVNVGFRLYQAGKDRVIGSKDSLTFKVGEGIGTPDDPHKIKF